MNEQANKTGKAISEWIQTYPWSDFLTITFRGPRHDSIAAVRDVGKYLAGENGLYKRAFVSAEPFRYQHNLHIHAIAHSVNMWKPVHPRSIEEECDRKFGRSSVSTIKSPRYVSEYCSKYASKWSDGDNYDFFGDWGIDK